MQGGAKALIRGKRSLDDVIKATDFDRLDLIPADLSYRALDLLLSDDKRSRAVLQRLLVPLADHYDVILLDCPPVLSLLAEAVFRLADALVVPVVPSTLSARTLEQLSAFLQARPEAGQPRVLPFFSIVDGNNALHADCVARLPERFPGFLTSRVPRALEVERMGIHRMPLTAYAPAHAASAAYRQLWAEVATALASDGR